MASAPNAIMRLFTSGECMMAAMVSLSFAMMAGGEELDELSHELEEFARTDRLAAAELAESGRGLAAEASAIHPDAQHEPPVTIPRT